MELINARTTLDHNAVPVSGKLLTWQQFHARFAASIKEAGNDDAAVMDKLVKANNLGQIHSMMEVEIEHLKQEHAHALTSLSKRLVTAQESFSIDTFNQAIIDTIEITNTAIKQLNLDHQTNLIKINAKYTVYKEKRKEFDVVKARKRAASKSITSQKKKRATIDSAAATNLSQHARGDTIVDDNIVPASVVPPLLAATTLMHTPNHNPHADDRAISDEFDVQLLRPTHLEIDVIDFDASPLVSEHAIVYKNTPHTTDEEFFLGLLD